MASFVDQKTIDSFAEYCDRHAIYEKFQYLVSRVLLSKPADPFQFMIDTLNRPRTCAIAIHGPPSSGQSQICENVCRIFDAVHVKVGQLLRVAIDKQSATGLQAKAYVDKGLLVPDAIILNLVFARLQESDVIEKGYILNGFPRTREQALSMQKKGVIPDHFVVFDVPDDVVVNRAVGLRYDPVTNRTYHVKFDPPPKNSQIEARLIRKASDTEPNMRARLSIYRKNLKGVTTAFANNLNVLSFSEGIIGNEETVYKDVFNILGRKPSTKAPRAFKIVVAGLPGSGKTKVAEALQQKFGFVHVSAKTIILEELAAETPLGAKLQPYLQDSDAIPQDLLVDIITYRLKKSDCQENGWVLEGFPNTTSQADILTQKGFLPNRVLWLEASAQVCKSRLLDRKYCPDTGRVVNLKNIPADLQSTDFSSWTTRSRDIEAKVVARMNEAKSLKTELEKIFGLKVAPDSAGIMQSIPAEGLGEGNGNDSNESLQKVLEIVENSLLRPVDVTYKWDV